MNTKVGGLSKVLIVIAPFSKFSMHRISLKIEGREEVDEMEVVDGKREELLERVKWKKEWEIRSTSGAVLVDMLYKAVDSQGKRHCYAMISNIVDMAWVELQANRIVIDII